MANPADIRRALKEGGNGQYELVAAEVMRSDIWKHFSRKGQEGLAPAAAAAFEHFKNRVIHWLDEKFYKSIDHHYWLATVLDPGFRELAFATKELGRLLQASF